MIRYYKASAMNLCFVMQKQHDVTDVWICPHFITVYIDISSQATL